MAAVIGASLPGGDARAQDRAAEAEAARDAVQRLDVDALLSLETVLSETLDDPVWDYTPLPGRRLVQLPITLGEPDKPTELDKPAVELRPGRFVAWRVPDPEDPDDAALPDEAPRLARSITLPGDGTLRYPLERAIPGGEVAAGTSAFQLALRRDRLLEFRPDRSSLPRQSPGQDVQEFRQELRIAQAELIAAQQEFRDMLAAVNEVPKELVLPRPEYVLAVFEVPDRLDSLRLGGPPPLPWEIDLDLLEDLRELVGGQARFTAEGLDRDELETVEGLLDWTAEGHPLTLRSTAVALRESGWIARARPDDPIFALMDRIIHGPDGLARAEVISGLATVVPPTPATARLLRESAGMLTPELRMVSLRNLFTAEAATIEQREDLVATAREILRDPSGPPAKEVVTEMVKASAENPEVTATLLDGVTFVDLPRERRREAVEAVIELAGRFELARRWVNDRILSVDDDALVGEAIAVLAGLEVDHALAESRRQRGGGFDATRDLVIREGDAVPPIPILSSRHGLFDQLESPRPARRATAFDALLAFTFEPVPRDRGSDAVQDLRYQRLQQAALRETPAPPEAVAFLGLQPEPNEAALVLIELVLRGGEPTAGAASAAILELGFNPLPLLERMNSDEQRVRFASRLYVEATGGVTPVTGLLRAPGASRELLPWLAQHIARGELPEASAWASEYRDLHEMLTLAAGDDRLLARAATGALLAQAEGPPADLDPLMRRLAQHGGDIDALRGSYESYRTELRRALLQDLAGRYRMEVVVTRDGRDNRIDLGEVALIASPDTGLAFANAALPLAPGDEPRQLRVESPVELKGLAEQALRDVPLERANRAMTLDPRAEGGWLGETTLDNGEVLTLRLTPAAG